MEESESLCDTREQYYHHEDREQDHRVQDRQADETEDRETVVKIEESGEFRSEGNFDSTSPSMEPSFKNVPVQYSEDQIVTFKPDDPNTSGPIRAVFPVIPGPSVGQVQRQLVPMYQGVVTLSFGREIILGPSKKFGTKNQTSYRIVTLSKYECDVCQFSYVGENVDKLKGMDKYKLCHKHICADLIKPLLP